MDELRALIGVDFVIGYHKVAKLLGKRKSMSQCGFRCECDDKEIQGNLHFLNNEDVVPRDHQAHDKVFKVRWLIDEPSMNAF